jgi:hypothetical protein
MARMPERRNLFAATALAVGGMILAFAVLPVLVIGNQPSMTRAEELKAANDLRQSVMQFGGAMALIVGLVFTGRTYVLSRSTQRIDQLSKAVEQIGSDSEAVRAGGAYNLWLLANQSPAHWPIAEELLTTLIRERAVSSASGSARRSDVAAALKVLGWRPKRAQGDKGEPLDLRHVDLSGMRLVAGNFERLRLDHAILESADLTDADLSKASLRFARLDKARLSSTDLKNADLTESRLRGANLYRVKLTGAVVQDCDFSDAKNAGADTLKGTCGAPLVKPPDETHQPS